MVGIRRRSIILIGAVVALVIVVAIIGVVASGMGRPAVAPTPTSSYTVQTLRPGEETILNSYGWVDQKNGIARIPISRAIDIIAARGLPSRPAGAQNPSNEGETIPSYSSSGTQPREWLH